MQKFKFFGIGIVEDEFIAVLFVNVNRVAVEGGDGAKFFRAVVVNVEQKAVAGRVGRKLFDAPFAAGRFGRNEVEYAVIATDDAAGCSFAVNMAVITVVLEHIVLDDGQFELMVKTVCRKIIGQFGGENLAGEAPIVFVFVVAL